MKLFLRVFGPLAVVLITACGDGRSDTATVEPEDNRQPLHIMTWRHLEQDRAIYEQFENRYLARIRVTVVSVPEMLRLARTRTLPPVDILLLPNIESAVRLRDAGALQPFFVNSFTNGNVDDRFMDNEGYFSGLTRWTMATIYNPKAVSISEASTYVNLAKLPLRGVRLGLAHPDSSGLAATVAGLRHSVSDEAAALWTKMMLQGAHGGASGNDAHQLDRMLAGETDAALVSIGEALRWMLNGDPNHYAAAKVWNIKFPQTDNDNSNVFNMTSIAVGFNAPNRPLAMQFVDFLYEEEVQVQLGDAWFEFPGQTFADINDYLITVAEFVGRKVSAEQIDQNIEAAWGIIERVGPSADR